MARSISTPFAVASTGSRWQVRIGTSWTDIDPISGGIMETTFKGSAKTVDVGPSPVLPHKSKFDVEAMTWDGMPVRRSALPSHGLFKDDRLS